MQPTKLMAVPERQADSLPCAPAGKTGEERFRGGVEMETGAKRDVPEAFGRKRRWWLRLFVLWRVLHYSFGVICTLGAIYIASLPGDPRVSTQKAVAALVTGGCAALMTLLRTSESGKAFNRAWRLLETACLRYAHDESVTVEALVEAVAKGEAMIAEVDA
jgi:hypothetical protein